MLIGASTASRAEYFLDLLNLDHHVLGADLVITGERRLDRQTLLQGELPVLRAQRPTSRRFALVPAGAGIITLANFLPDFDHFRCLTGVASAALATPARRKLCALRVMSVGSGG
jgi:hypothetical protein